MFRPTAASQPDALGAVFTKRWVVELLLDLAGYVAPRDLSKLTAVEPAAGEGAFLGPMIERLLSSCKQHSLEIGKCRESIVAYELDKSSAARARDIAIDLLRNHGVSGAEAQALASTWIRVGDYLTEAIGLSADFVIGNPPYVRLEAIPEDTAEFYRSSYGTMRGRADLYVAFFEAALSQLKPEGVCAFICADRWMRNQYGGELRALITSAHSIDIVVEMHNAEPFLGEVDAYPAITVISRKRQGQVVVAKVDSALEEPDGHRLSAALRGLPAKEFAPYGLKTAVVDMWFRGSEPWPCTSPEQLKLLRRLEQTFSPLETHDKRTRVGIGVATGNDQVFITTDPGLVEPSRLLKLALCSDIATGMMRWSGHYLVDPWDESGLVNLSEFPRLRQYLDQNNDLVRRRNTAQKNPEGWYRTIDRVNHKLAGERKLYIADIKNSLNPVLDIGETYPHHNLYYIQSSEWDLEVLGGLLMSVVGQFFVQSYGVRMRGGYFRFQAQYLRRIRVPSADAISEDQARNLKIAFQTRNQELSNWVALQIYDIHPDEMEAALGY